MIYIASDHRGYNLKEKIKQWLTGWSYKYKDLGNDYFDPEDDYPDFATLVAKRVEEWKSGRVEEKERATGIVICGSGVGVDIVVNRFTGVRCGLGFSVEQIKKARKDDDINCLALAADFLNEETAKEIVKTFLGTEFLQEEKKIRRINKIENFKL